MYQLNVARSIMSKGCSICKKKVVEGNSTTFFCSCCFDFLCSSCMAEQQNYKCGGCGDEINIISKDGGLYILDDTAMKKLVSTLQEIDIPENPKKL